AAAASETLNPENAKCRRGQVQRLVRRLLLPAKSQKPSFILENQMCLGTGLRAVVSFEIALLPLF
ncbi:unnamed protein product, partial [marine sediment metagenome]